MFVVPDKENMTRYYFHILLLWQCDTLNHSRQIQDSRYDNRSVGHSIWGRVLPLSCALPSQLPNQSAQVAKKKISFIILFLHRVKLLTTGNNTVRFNPNFYKTGKVILYSWFHEDFWFLSSTQTRQVITQWNTGLKVPRCACDMCHSILSPGVSLNSWHLGRAFLEPCTLPFFLTHIYPGTSHAFGFNLPSL